MVFPKPVLIQYCFREEEDDSKKDKHHIIGIDSLIIIVEILAIETYFFANGILAVQKGFRLRVKLLMSDICGFEEGVVTGIETNICIA